MSMAVVCPFCSSLDFEIINVENGYKRVRCTNCGALSPKYMDEDDEYTWKTRPIENNLRKKLHTCQGLKRDANKEVKSLQEKLEKARDALDGLLDGLDANYDSRYGLSTIQWNDRIQEARKIMEKL